MSKIIDSIAHNRRAASELVSYDKGALRNIGDVAAWNRDRLVEDILLGKAAEFREELPWEFDGRTYRALLFDRDIAVSYHIDSDTTHYGKGNTWVLTKFHEGIPTIVGKFRADQDFYDKAPIEQAKQVALKDWNTNYANPSERSYLHLAKSNREVLRAALANDGRGDLLIKAQMGPVESKPTYVSHQWMGFDPEEGPTETGGIDGIEIKMSWMGHDIVYQYEFSGHGDPLLMVDGHEVDWDVLQTMFGRDSDEVWAIISDAANEYTPPFPERVAAMRLDDATVELCKLLEPEIRPIMARIRSGESDRFQGMGVIKHICSQNGISFAQFEQYLYEKSQGKFAQMGPGTLPPMNTPKLESHPDEQGQSDNGEQPAGTGKHPVNYERPLSGESIPGTGMIGVGKGNMGVAAQAAPPAPPPPAAAAPEAEVGQEAVDPAAPPAEEAPPVDDGMSLLDALTDAQNALDSIKQKIDSGETILHGQEVEPVEDAPEPGIQPQINQPAGAAPITAEKRVGQHNFGPYGPGNMQMVMLPLKQQCECESLNCHPNLDCNTMADGQNVTIYGTQLCDECASKMPTKYMRINQGVEMNRKGQVKPPPLPGAPNLDLPSDSEIDEAFDEATSTPQSPPLSDLIAVYENIQAQTKALESQLKSLKEQGKIMLVDHIAPIMRELEGQSTELEGKIYRLAEWTQASISYGKVFDALFEHLNDAQKELANTLKAANSTESIRQEIRTEKPGKPKKQSDGEDMGDAAILAALNDVVSAYEQINAAADTVLGNGMTMGAAVDDKTCPSCEEGNHQRCSGKCDCGCPNSKQAVDDAAAKYYKDYYKSYGEQFVTDPREARIALILETAIQAGVNLSDEDIAKYLFVLEDRPMVHGAFLRYAVSSTEPTMDEMAKMVFEKSQSDHSLSKILDKITIEHLVKNSDLANKMTPEEQIAILVRAMRGNKMFYNRINKLYRKALGLDTPEPTAAEPQPTVPQAGPEILTAALKIMAAGMPKMTTPKVRKGEDDAVDVIEMKDLAKDTDVSVPGQIPFEHEKPVKRGKYLYMTVKWSPEDVKVSGNSLQVAIGNYIRSLVSHRWPTDYGYNGIPVIEEMDPEAGTAVVYFQASTKADAPLAVSSTSK